MTTPSGARNPPPTSMSHFSTLIKLGETAHPDCKEGDDTQCYAMSLEGVAERKVGYFTSSIFSNMNLTIGLRDFA